MPHELSLLERYAICETLTYVAWADGAIAPEERWASRGAAVALALGRDDFDVAEVLRRGPLPLDELELGTLSERARVVAYASAAWMTLVDGLLTTVERAVLDVLRHRLRLDDAQASLLEAAAFLTRGRPSATREWHEEYASLLGTIDDLGAQAA